MKFVPINIILAAFFLHYSAHAADSAYDYLIMEATSAEGNTANLVVHIGDNEPGEISFGIMKNEVFIGQRLYFRSIASSSYEIEVIAEDVAAPSLDKSSGLVVQDVKKRIFKLKAEGKPITININGKSLTIKPNTISVSRGTKKAFIEQAAPSNP